MKGRCEVSLDLMLAAAGRSCSLMSFESSGLCCHGYFFVLLFLTVRFYRDNSMCGILHIKMVSGRLLEMTSSPPLHFMFVYFRGRTDKAFLLR